MDPTAVPDDQTDTLLSEHGLRRTRAARSVLAYLIGHAGAGFTHAQLQLALQEMQQPVVGRGTLYRLVDRFVRAGLVVCRPDAHGVRRYQAALESPHELPHLECNTCGIDQVLTAELSSKARALQEAAHAAVKTLLAMGCRDLHIDLAVRGVCAQCASKFGPLSR